MRAREWGKRLRVSIAKIGRVMKSEARRIHFLQLVLFLFLVSIFLLCFSIPFLRDRGKAKVVFQNGAVKIEEVPVQPSFPKSNILPAF